jgi:hypothetical protein
LRKYKRKINSRRKQFNLILNKELWVRGSQQIRGYREEHKSDCCPVSEIPYGEGLDMCVLDHDHNTGLTRGCLNGRSNLLLGRVELYFRKLFGKTDVELLTLLKNLVEYLEQSEKLEPKLHGEIIEVEKRKVSRWKIETLVKNLELSTEKEYSKHEVVELWLQKFIDMKEKEIVNKRRI